MGGGAWPFLVGGVICLVNSVNERDLNLLNSRAGPSRLKTQVHAWRLASGAGEGRGRNPSFAFVFSSPPRRVSGRRDRRPCFLEGLPASSRRKPEAITGL